MASTSLPYCHAQQQQQQQGLNLSVPFPYPYCPYPYPSVPGAGASFYLNHPYTAAVAIATSTTPSRSRKRPHTVASATTRPSPPQDTVHVTTYLGQPNGGGVQDRKGTATTDPMSTHGMAQALVDDQADDLFADSPLDSFPNDAFHPPPFPTPPAHEQHDQPSTTSTMTGNMQMPPPSGLVNLHGIVTVIRQSGFRNEDEIHNAIRTVQEQQKQQQQQQQQQQNPPEPPIQLTVETVLCALIQAREDAQLARDMDEARRLSELEYEQEIQRMKQVESLKLHEQLLQDWSLDDLLRPCSTATNIATNIGGFGQSWLLNHAELLSTLETIMTKKKKNNQNDKDTLHQDSDTSTDDSTNVYIHNKRLLLRLLKLERNARKWYSTGIPKWYFTLEVANRLVPLLTRPASTDDTRTAESPVPASHPQDCNINTRVMARMQMELEAICTEVEEGHSLMAKQDKNQIPWIYVHAHGKYAPKTSSSSCTSLTLSTSTTISSKDGQRDANNDDDDDDIIVLDEEQVRQLTGRSCDPSETVSAKGIMVDP